MEMNSEHAAAVLSKIFENGFENDPITLIAGVGGQRIPIHRIVLMANSEYFTASLGPNFIEADENEFVLDETDAPTLKAIVDFCYSGCIDLTEENASKYLAIASSLQLHFLESKCWQLIADKLSMDNVVETLVAADKYSGHEIRQKAFTLFRDSFDKLPSSYIFGLDYRLMKEILGSDTTDATEEFIFERLMSWFRSDEDNRGKHMPELLKLIRLEFIPMQFLNGDTIYGVYKKFDCLDYLFAEYRRRATCPTPAAGMRRRRLVIFLFKQSKGDLYGAKISAVKIKRFSCASNEIEEVGEIELGDRTDFEVTLHENKLYIMGGRINNKYLKSVTMIDLTTKKEEVLPEMNVAREAFPSVVLGKHIYVFGGWDHSHAMNSCERFDLESKTWTVLKPMNVARNRASAAIINGYIYVASGIGKNRYTCAVELYDPKNDEWSLIASINVERISFALFKADMFLYAIGHTHTVERYDVLKNTWTKMKSFDGCERITSSTETDEGVFVVMESGEFGKIGLTENGDCSFQQLGKFHVERKSYRTRTTELDHEAVLANLADLADLDYLAMGDPLI